VRLSPALFQFLETRERFLDRNRWPRIVQCPIDLRAQQFVARNFPAVDRIGSSANTSFTKFTSPGPHVPRGLYGYLACDDHFRPGCDIYRADDIIAARAVSPCFGGA